MAQYPDLIKKVSDRYAAQKAIGPAAEKMIAKPVRPALQTLPKQIMPPQQQLRTMMPKLKNSVPLKMPDQLPLKVRQMKERKLA